jgi:hypothetical protein
MEVLMHTHATHILIAGSRHATRAMLAYARRAVLRAHQLGWTILVGDNPRGIDLAVVQACRRLKVPASSSPASPASRDFGCRHGRYVMVTRDLYRSAGGDLLGGYTARDRWMVDNCQRALFVWNGDSPGTKAGYDYAVQRGRPAHLINFDRSPQP